jgi:hypothetical protein
MMKFCRDGYACDAEPDGIKMCSECRCYLRQIYSANVFISNPLYLYLRGKKFEIRSSQLFPVSVSESWDAVQNLATEDASSNESWWNLSLVQLDSSWFKSLPLDGQQKDLHNGTGARIPNINLHKGSKSNVHVFMELNK